MYYRLPKDATGRESLLAGADAAIAEHDLSLTVGLDDLNGLDADVMGTLIVALRRMREAGGTVTLHVTRPALLDALSVSGLDRVFTLVSQPQEPQLKPAPKARKAGSARKIAGGLAGIFATLWVLGGTHAAIGATLLGPR